MLILMGFAVGAVTVMFSICFGMFLQRKIDGTDKEDEE